jgi:hypothetical protein
MTLANLRPSFRPTLLLATNFASIYEQKYINTKNLESAHFLVDDNSAEPLKVRPQHATQPRPILCAKRRFGLAHEGIQ